ncbi:MAG: DNA polymerase III subunit beta [Bacteriovoracaceae bacterium]|jgi:DNA polymerase III subunit beta|nr:DNA polymerase III subunit beta [Bacteriovoracaceae bacterium]
MKVRVQVNVLKDAVNRMVSVVDKKTTRPVLTYTLIKASSDNTLTLFGTDLEVSAKIKIPADIQSEGAFCINPKSLSDILREMPNEQLDLEIVENQNILKLSMGQIKFSLLISSTEDFPTLSFENIGNKFVLKSEQIQKIISKTSHAISNDETRLFLNGIFLQKVKSKLNSVATDGHRLALFETNEFDTDSGVLEEGIILPKKGVVELKKLAENFANEELQFSVDESFFYVNAQDKYCLGIRLIARDFPRYQTNIPSKTAYALDVDKELFITAIKRIKVLANEKTNGVRLSLTKDSLRISSNHPSLGDATETIAVKYSGKEMDIGFNAKYLLDSFSVIDVDSIRLEFNNELSPVILKTPALPEYFGVIMPLRLQY